MALSPALMRAAGRGVAVGRGVGLGVVVGMSVGVGEGPGVAVGGGGVAPGRVQPVRARRIPSKISREVCFMMCL